MTYTVTKIEEDLDYGCEERPEGYETLAVVSLRDEDGEVSVSKFPDAHLYRENIEDGSKVYIDEDGSLQKVLDEDWTKNCNTSNVNISKFTDMMLQVKAGKQVEWSCPFCGGKVGLLAQEDNHTVIGCHSCDMRITLDN